MAASAGWELLSRLLLPNSTLCISPGSQLAPLPDSPRINQPWQTRPGTSGSKLSNHSSVLSPKLPISLNPLQPGWSPTLHPGPWARAVALLQAYQTTEGLRWLQWEKPAVANISRVTPESRTLGDLLRLLPKRCEGCGLGCHGDTLKPNGREKIATVELAGGGALLLLTHAELKSHSIKGRHDG